MTASTAYEQPLLTLAGQTGKNRKERDKLCSAINQRLINDQRDEVLAFFVEADWQQLPVFHSRTGSGIPQLDENAEQSWKLLSSNSRRTRKTNRHLIQRTNRTAQVRSRDGVRLIP